MKSVGLLSIAARVPSVVRTNEYFTRRHRDAFAEMEERTLAQVFQDTPSTEASAAFDIEMARYLADPLRGTVERRALAPGQGPIDLGEAAAREALAAAGLDASDVDLIIACSFLPEHPGLGDAAFLAARLGVPAPAWNLESTCSSALQALRVATSLVATGAHRRVLVVVTCTYSRTMDESDTLSWFLGDGAGAFIVGEVPAGEGLLGAHSINTSSTCGAFFWEPVADVGGSKLVVRAGRGGGRALRDTSAPDLRACCEGALRAAGLALDDIAFFVCNTPVAWYAAFFARALGIPEERTLTTYPWLANMGPALMPVNLHTAAASGRIGRGDLVLVYTVGSVSTAAAAVMRWGMVGLGPALALGADDQTRQSA